MGLFNIWGKSRAQAPLLTEQELNAQIISQLHDTCSETIKDHVRLCGGIGNADSAIARYAYIISVAQLTLNPPDLARNSSNAPSPTTDVMNDIKRGYDYALARYLQKRLGQIQANIGVHHFPKMAELEKTSEENRRRSNAQMEELFRKYDINPGSAFSRSSRPSQAEASAKRIREQCADLSDRLDQFRIRSTTPVEIQMDSDFIAFIRNQPTDASGAPTPSGRK